jgi:hypothetical protein
LLGLKHCEQKSPAEHGMAHWLVPLPPVPPLDEPLEPPELVPPVPPSSPSPSSDEHPVCQASARTVAANVTELTNRGIRKDYHAHAS